MLPRNSEISQVSSVRFKVLDWIATSLLHQIVPLDHVVVAFCKAEIDDVATYDVIMSVLLLVSLATSVSLKCEMLSIKWRLYIF